MVDYEQFMYELADKVENLAKHMNTEEEEKEVIETAKDLRDCFGWHTATVVGETAYQIMINKLQEIE